jgi:hypothetical protein
VRLLLNTQVPLLWPPARSSPNPPRELMAGSACVVSVASVWEVDLKHRLGKLPIAPRRLRDEMRSAGALILCRADVLRDQDGVAGSGSRKTASSNKATRRLLPDSIGIECYLPDQVPPDFRKGMGRILRQTLRNHKLTFKRLRSSGGGFGGLQVSAENWMRSSASSRSASSSGGS